MSAIMPKKKIDAFVGSILENREKFDAEKRVKAKGVLRSIPLDKKSAEEIFATEDIDFAPIAKEKQGQRFDDVQVALEDAVEQGVESLDDFISWLGVQDHDYDTSQVMDFAHAYIRLGKRKRPESMAGFND